MGKLADIVFILLSVVQCLLVLGAVIYFFPPSLLWAFLFVGIKVYLYDQKSRTPFS